MSGVYDVSVEYKYVSLKRRREDDEEEDNDGSTTMHFSREPTMEEIKPFVGELFNQNQQPLFLALLKKVKRFNIKYYMIKNFEKAELTIITMGALYVHDLPPKLKRRRHALATRTHSHA